MPAWPPIRRFGLSRVMTSTTCPVSTGKSVRAANFCPAPREKIFRFPAPPNQFYPRSTHPTEGRVAIVTSAGWMRWTRLRRARAGLLQGGSSVSKTFARTTGDKSAFVNFGVPAHGPSKCRWRWPRTAKPSASAQFWSSPLAKSKTWRCDGEVENAPGSLSAVLASSLTN